MQTLARVNRTFRGKDAGLLVAHAALVENSTAALAEYTKSDQQLRPLGKQVEEAIELASALVAQLDALVAGYDCEAKLVRPKGWIKAALGLTAWHRNRAVVGPPIGDPSPDPTAATSDSLAAAKSLRSGDAMTGRTVSTG